MGEIRCDLCGVRIFEEDKRFKVSIDVEAIRVDGDEDDCPDHEELMREFDRNLGFPLFDDPDFLGEFDEDVIDERYYIFNMCEDCKDRYVRDPLTRKSKSRTKLMWQSSN